MALGAAAAPELHPVRLWAALGAFFLAVGVAAHALDELHGHPLRTRLSDRTLLALAVAGLGGAVAIGVAGLFVVSASLAPFVVAGAFMVLAYNLELFGGRFHTDFWFAAAWGAFPALTGFWVNALGIHSLGEAAAGVLRHRRLLRAQRRPAPPLDPGARAAPQDGRGQRRAAARRRHHARAHRRPPRRPAGRRPGGALRWRSSCSPRPGRGPAC